MILTHAGFQTVYSHLSGFAPGVEAGVSVGRGNVIGYVGRTGVATGNHLHFQVEVGGERVALYTPIMLNPYTNGPDAPTCG